MAWVIWVTGPAACGKSTLTRTVVELLTHERPEAAVTVLSDEQLLLEAVAADLGHTHHRHPFGDWRFVADGYLFDEGVRRISDRLADLVAADPDAVAVVELARGGHADGVDVTYRHALDLIDPRLWQHSTVVALAVPWPERCRRNLARIRTSGHGTAAEVMEALYRGADPGEWRRAGITAHVLDGRTHPRELARQILTRARLPATR
ncbi:hypothetical protein DQ384_38110 [Sphaerisporangium album]|uniref:UDP-N-acetylglucosamine kinase n=1 Tax=Sphaerisporangium album TaxID=509200 RepID=A0A367ENW2_9ACTN|nr:hypothetical protein [Sphaerisporangium album]RCG19097.1 hypothetical protein DQ384_38110 [Sphaerisporangium album]